MSDQDAVDISARIGTARGQRIILDRDLARIYGVETRALNQAVKRNPTRFPEDFAFALTLDEYSTLQRSRSQSVILKRGQNLKHPPLAFTEHGAVMAASVLNSPQAVQMSLFVVRAFLRLREWVSGQVVLAGRLARLEGRVGQHDHELKAVIAAVRKLIGSPDPPPARRIGFRRSP